MPKSDHTLQEKRDFARDLRRNMTRAEWALWYQIRRNHFSYRFQRQTLLQGYIVDFYCAQLRLVIEVDGSIHDVEDVAADDEQRERILENYGFLVLRFGNEDVLNHMPVVLTRLWDECAVRRTALKAFASQKVLKNYRKVPEALNSSCASVEKPSPAATVDKISVEPILATPEDYRLINQAWRKLVTSTRERSLAFNPSTLTTSTERAFDQKHRLGEWIKKRSESAALTVKGMHVTDSGRRQA